MHEMSIVENLIELCRENLKKSNANKILEVHIKVGRLSGVEAHYLEACYDVFRQGTVCEDAKLIIKIQDVIIKCSDCGFEGILKENHFICPKCKNTNLSVIDGEDMYLMQIIME